MSEQQKLKVKKAYTLYKHYSDKLGSFEGSYEESVKLRGQMKRAHSHYLREKYELEELEKKGSVSMTKGKITVHRRAHKRKGYTRKTGVYIQPTDVKEATYEMVDIGKKGKGEPFYTIPSERQRLMTKIAQKHKFITEDQHIQDMSQADFNRFTVILADEVGLKRARGMLRYQINVRLYASPTKEPERYEFRTKMETGLQYLERMKRTEA